MSPNPHLSNFLIVGLDQMRFQAGTKRFGHRRLIQLQSAPGGGLPFVHVCATALSLTPLDLVVWGKASASAGAGNRAQHELLPLFKSAINNDP
jgi:hypothetical protein